MHSKGAGGGVANAPGLVEQAMKQRDVDLELAVAALRDATEDASAAVHSLMHLVRRKTTLKPRRRQEPEARAATGAGMGAPSTPTVAQQLHQIAYRLRLLESSILRSSPR